jgi:hypothetical protein
MYPIITQRRLRRRTRISTSYDFRLNQLCKILETRYLSLINSPTITDRLGRAWINSDQQCLWDIYVDEDCSKLLHSAVKVVSWRITNNKLKYQPNRTL